MYGNTTLSYYSKKTVIKCSNRNKKQLVIKVSYAYDFDQTDQYKSERSDLKPGLEQ